MSGGFAQGRDMAASQQKKMALVLEEVDKQQQQKQKQKHEREEAKRKRSAEDDDFFNRRMTRSAFNQKLGSSDDANNQQKQKPQQQREGKKKKMLVKDDHDVSRKMKWRSFTNKEWQDYKKRLTESDGFDAPDLPDDVAGPSGSIVPIRIEQYPGVLKRLSKNSKLALGIYNNENNTKYRFVKVLKANVQPVAGSMHYITFQAKDMAGSPPKNFQALLHTFLGETDVKFCRPEPKSHLLKVYGCR